jgi:two-component system, NarL family, nitrate/nitrite response regulator NarL
MHPPGQPQAASVSVLIVDDNRLFDDAIASALSRMEMRVIGCAADAEEALELAKRHRPTLALVDLDLRASAMTGRDIAAEILRTCQTKVLAITRSDALVADTNLLSLGLSGFVLKDGTLSRFERGLRAALDGDVVVPQRQPNGNGPRSTSRASEDAELLAGQLTEREFEVLALLVEGVSGRTIAGRLGISSNTVRTHVQSILSKLQVHSRLEAAAWAVRHDLLQSLGGRGGARPSQTKSA